MTKDLVIIQDEKLLINAKKLGFSQVILAKTFKNKQEIETAKSKGFTTMHLLSKNDSRELNRFSQLADFTGIFGGTPKTNAFAANSKKIDFLLMPSGYKKNKTDYSTLRVCKKNKVNIGLLVNDFLKVNDFQRIGFYRNYLLIAKMMNKLKLPIFVFSGAATIDELKEKKELEEFGKSLGFNKIEKIINKKNKKIPGYNIIK